MRTLAGKNRQSFLLIQLYSVLENLDIAKSLLILVIQTNHSP